MPLAGAAFATKVNEKRFRFGADAPSKGLLRHARNDGIGGFSDALAMSPKGRGCDSIAARQVTARPDDAAVVKNAGTFFQARSTR